MTCDLIDGEREGRKVKSLVSGHSCVIVKIINVERRLKDPVTLVQIQNTWTAIDWDGDWSDNSDLWTEDVKKKVGFVPAKEDGLFWMSLDDFINEFTYFSFSKMED